MTTTISAKIVADSISPDGHRLTTFEIVYPRFIHSEVMTHAVLDRNSASSRAIPFEKQLNRLLNDPVHPVRWPAEQAGMQGGADLEGGDLVLAQRVWDTVAADTGLTLANYLIDVPDKSARLHKSVLNRMIEPWMWHTVAITGTAWRNFFALRDHEAAQPEFQVLARAMKAAYDASQPEHLMEGEWHLPYRDEVMLAAPKELHPRISAARVARTSYETQNGKRDVMEDIKLFDRLATARPMHASPMGQVARVDEWNQHHVPVPLLDGGVFVARLPKVGKFIGYRQFRHDLEMAEGYQSFS